MPIVLNRSVLSQELKKFDLSSIEDKAKNIAEEEIFKIKKELIDNFNNHPVTKELEGGAEAQNESSTLNGIGNLTTYIGFSPSSNPTEPVRQILNTVEVRKEKFKKNFNNNEIIFEFDVSAPTIEEIEEVGSLPFEPGQSWIKGIENGISGFGAYIYGKIFKNSRSGKALQSKNSFRQGSFRPVKYISEIMGKFYLKLKK